MEIDKNELLNALLAEIPTPLMDDEVTAHAFMEAANISREGARGILERKVKDGELTKRQALRSDGRIVTAYRKV